PRGAGALPAEGGPQERPLSPKKHRRPRPPRETGKTAPRRSGAGDRDVVRAHRIHFSLVMRHDRHSTIMPGLSSSSLPPFVSAPPVWEPPPLPVRPRVPY